MNNRQTEVENLIEHINDNETRRAEKIYAISIQVIDERYDIFHHDMRITTLEISIVSINVTQIRILTKKCKDLIIPISEI